MGTVIRSELSENSQWHISKYKYLELKNFCLQYPEWKSNYIKTDNELAPSGISNTEIHSSGTSDNVSLLATYRAELSTKINLIDALVKEADEFLSQYILLAVTENYSYPYLKTKLNIPCGKNMFYDRYRKFFWLLAKER